MLVNVIHSSVRPERYPRLIKELETQNIKDLTTIWEGEHDTRSVVRSINLSHKKIIEWAKHNDMPFIITLEDDVRFSDPNSFNHFMATMPKDFDLYLGGIYIGEILPDNTITSFSGFHCYITHKRFYDTFLSLPDDVHIDRAMSGKGKFIVSNPFVADQYEGISSNTGKQETYNHLLEGRSFYKSC